MNYLVHPSHLKGRIDIPPSKSETLRAILFGSLGKGKTIIQNPLASPDKEAMIRACSLLGANIDSTPGILSINGICGKVSGAEDIIDAGNSGIVLRFITAVGALACRPIVITGDRSIRYQRPMGTLLQALQSLGVKAASMRGDGGAPVIIQGPLKPGKTFLNGADSQPVSALLIASAFIEGDVEIFVESPGEKPWVGLTLHWLKNLGIPFQNENYSYFKLPGKADYNGFEYSVPGDWSSCAFPIAAALITKSEVLITNVDMNQPQGDKELIDVFQKMGACLEIDKEKKSILVKNTRELQGIDIDINPFIDAINILAVTACFAKGKTRIYNAAIAKTKECDRIRCLALELKKMGAKILEEDDGLTIYKSPLKGAHLSSHGDHRMAMALTVAALAAKGSSRIENTACIAKSFPDFLNSFQNLGARIKTFI